MADSGKQSPLGVNVLGSLLNGHDIDAPNNTTFFINPVAESYFGKSKSNAQYDPGKIVNDTCLKWLTNALAVAWDRSAMNTGIPSPERVINPQTYDAMLNIGQSRIAALGNSKPPTYQVDDPSGYWSKYGGPANTGFAITGNVDHGQEASWDPWDSGYDPGDPSGPLNPNSEVTKWGWVRAMALQAYNEFWWNAPIEYADPPGDDYSLATIDDNPAYKDFTSYFLTADSFIDQSNKAIIAVQNAQTFLQGTFSNQDDLISADISGISLSARAFGQDLINLGKALDLQGIGKFGLPSVLLQTLKTNNAVTQSVILTLLVSGLSKSEIENISLGNTTPDKLVEQKIYAAFLLIKGQDLVDILSILNCKTRGLNSLADLLSVKKLFPLSYRTLTVPVYNTEPGPTNSKTYYLLFINDELNPQLVIPRIKETIGVIIPPEPPPIVVEPPPAPPPPQPPRIPEPEVIVIPQPPEVPIPLVVQPPQPPVIVPPPAVPVPVAIPQAPTSGGGGGCVTLESYVPHVEITRKHLGRPVTQAWMLEKDMTIALGTENLELVNSKVVDVLNDYQPCVRVMTKDGISLICSTTAPLYTKESGFVDAPETLGLSVAVMRDGLTWFSEVVSNEYVGHKFVRVIDTGDNSFWAGETDNGFILHHNVYIDREIDKIAKK